MPAFATLSAQLRREECSVWIMLRKNIASRNALLTIPLKVTLFATIKTLDILIFLQTSGNHLSYLSIIMVMRFNIDCILDPFLQEGLTLPLMD